MCTHKARPTFVSIHSDRFRSKYLKETTVFALLKVERWELWVTSSLDGSGLAEVYDKLSRVVSERDALGIFTLYSYATADRELTILRI